MSQEIKFRVWMPAKKRFCDGSPFRLSNIYKEAGHQYVAGKAEYARVDDPANVQEYTGLQDKTGMPIYEGDILTLDMTDKAKIIKETSKFFYEKILSAAF